MDFRLIFLTGDGVRIETGDRFPVEVEYSGESWRLLTISRRRQAGLYIQRRESDDVVVDWILKHRGV
jgi:hypothetical protein